MMKFWYKKGNSSFQLPEPDKTQLQQTNLYPVHCHLILTMGSESSIGIIGEIWQYRDKLSLLHHDFQVLTVKCAACLCFCDTLLHNSSTPNDIIEMSLMPSGPPSFVCGAQTLT